MRDKFAKFFKKRDEYYDVGDKPFEGEEKNISKNECRKLKKENEKFKKDFKKVVLEKFKSRRSIRKFSDQKIEWKKIYDIIEAGLYGPVAGGIQNYKVIVIQDSEVKQELGKLSFQQYWLADAPYILVILRDNYRLMQLYPSEGEVYSIQNSAALIENILMMAHFHDLGACWIEAYDNKVLKEFLKVPPEFVVDAIIPIGYPLENPVVKKDSFDAHVYYEKYNQKERENYLIKEIRK